MKLAFRDIAFMAVLISVSYFMSNVKIMEGITLATAPAFLAAFLFRDYKAGIVGAAAHLLSSSTAGFPLGVQTHVATAIIMFLLLTTAGWLIKKTNVVAGVGFIFLINSFVMPLALFIAQPFNETLYATSVVDLAPATLVNLIIAGFVARPLRARFISPYDERR